jgi:hypothetical protein
VIAYESNGGCWDDPPDMPGQGIGEGTDDEEDEAMWEEWRVKHAKWVLKRRVVLPDLPPGGCEEWMKARGFAGNRNEGGTTTSTFTTTTAIGSPGSDDGQGMGLKEKVSLAGRDVQVFVKLGRVELVSEW